jgi:hypothetical protein
MYYMVIRFYTFNFLCLKFFILFYVILHHEIWEDCISVLLRVMSNHEYHKILPMKEATSHSKSIRESP